jgi:hypothetical protein
VDNHRWHWESERCLWKLYLNLPGTDSPKRSGRPRYGLGRRLSHRDHHGALNSHGPLRSRLAATLIAEKTDAAGGHVRQIELCLLHCEMSSSASELAGLTFSPLPPK